MTVKCLGGELNAFMQDKSIWTEGCWFDDVYVEVNGQADPFEYNFEGADILSAEADVLVQGGEYHIAPGVNSTFFNLEEKLRDWLAARRVTTIVIEVTNDQIEECKTAIAKLPGVRIVS